MEIFLYVQCMNVSDNSLEGKLLQSPLVRQILKLNSIENPCVKHKSTHMRTKECPQIPCFIFSDSNLMGCHQRRLSSLLVKRGFTQYYKEEYQAHVFLLKILFFMRYCFLRINCFPLRKWIFILFFKFYCETETETTKRLFLMTFQSTSQSLAIQLE